MGPKELQVNRSKRDFFSGDKPASLIVSMLVCSRLFLVLPHFSCSFCSFRYVASMLFVREEEVKHRTTSAGSCKPWNRTTTLPTLACTRYEDTMLMVVSVLVSLAFFLHQSDVCLLCSNALVLCDLLLLTQPLAEVTSLPEESYCSVCSKAEKVLGVGGLMFFLELTWYLVNVNFVFMDTLIYLH